MDSSYGYSLSLYFYQRRRRYSSRRVQRQSSSSSGVRRLNLASLRYYRLATFAFYWKKAVRCLWGPYFVYSKTVDGEGPSLESSSEVGFINSAASGSKMESKLSSSTSFLSFVGSFSPLGLLLTGLASNSSSSHSESFSWAKAAKVSLGAIAPSCLFGVVCEDFVDVGVGVGSSGARSDSVVSGFLAVPADELCRKKRRSRQIRTPASTLSKLSVTFPRRYLMPSSGGASLRYDPT